MTTVTNNATSQAQLMLMLQQLVQNNPVNNNDQNTGTQNNSPSAPASTGPSLIGGSPAFSGDVFALLVQTQAPIADSNAASGQSTGQQSTFGQDFQQLVQAIQSGNLSGAQQAYTAVSQDVSAFNESNAPDASKNPLLTALNQIGSDLQSGNITGAQQTLSSLQQTQDLHHHHHDENGGSDASAADATTSSSSTSGAASPPGTLTETNADGSITTITTNPDGSVTTTTTPPPTQSNPSSANSLQDLLAALQQLGIA